MDGRFCEYEGMPRKTFPYVHKQLTRHGRWVFYFRQGKGKRTRLPCPSDPTFKKAYMAALFGGPVKTEKTRPDTLKWLWERYTNESARWAGYSPATKKQQSLIMAQVLKTASKANLAAITQDVVQAGLDKRHETPAAAGNFLKTMKGLFSWARKMRLVKVDPTIGVEPISYKTEGFPAWTIEDVKAFRSTHATGTPERLAMELMLLAGLRRSDVVLVGRQHITGRVLSLSTAKTGARISIELPDDLMTMIDATPRRGLHLVENANGKPFTKESFGNWFRIKCADAHVTKSAHGLRKLSATLAAEGGAATHHLLAQYGWKNIATAEIYTKGVDRKRLGIEASRIVADQIQNIAFPHPNPGEGEVDDKASKNNVL